MDKMFTILLKIAGVFFMLNSILLFLNYKESTQIGEGMAVLTLGLIALISHVDIKERD